ncbi:DUF1289 domain-containing protein [Undibacterium fentianense]|uniref:DUF1289 domain-containing protein n=1 Tax=Undibacterium fentianense TaxID=2828728 RepID=A0A941E742_9BURK|nr:DUF1289 domain-containing protein [Undibacterium fentianense]MBR7801809.1 DUF1289 domain-containing protein [Undibacterium fentianense]
MKIDDKNPNEIPSPCIKLCQIGPDQLCLGCLRTLDEIAAWSRASNELKLEIHKQISLRRERLDKVK